MKLKKNKAFNFIKPFYKYSDEVLGIDASLDSIKHLISTGNYTFRGNEIYGTRNTNNGNKVLLYLKIDDNVIYSEIEGKYVKSAKKYKRIDEKTWVVGETIIKQKNYRTDIYTTAYLFKNYKEISRLVRHKSLLPTSKGEINYDAKVSNYVIGKDLYRVVENDDGDKTYSKCSNYDKLLIDNRERYKEINEFNVEDYYMKRT